MNEILLLKDYGYDEGTSKQVGVPYHNGIDISIGDNDPIPCFVDDTCKVERVNPVFQDEGTIVITDVNGWEYVFAHMDNVQVKQGDLIRFGTILGYQDSKGQSVQQIFRPFWQHLHFALRKIDEINGENAYFWNYGHKYADTDNKIDGFVDPNVQCEKVVVRVAEAICKYESGWTKEEENWHPKAITLKENNNPGGLRWSPFQVGSKNKFAVFNTPLDGFKAVVWDLEQKANGNTKTKLNGKSTILEFCKVWAPKEDGNTPFKYAEFIYRECGFRSINDHIGDWLLTELDWVRKYNNYDKSRRVKTWGSDLISLLFNYVWNRFFKNKGR